MRNSSNDHCGLSFVGLKLPDRLLIGIMHKRETGSCNFLLVIHVLDQGPMGDKLNFVSGVIGHIGSEG